MSSTKTFVVAYSEAFCKASSDISVMANYDWQFYAPLDKPGNNLVAG